jgi:CheY-like chemotaxis protein
VRVERDGDEGVLRVRDFGLGLEPDLLPRVFDLFVQGRRTLERSQGGLGIGLTLVRRLVELHEGSVAALSEGDGKGSEFVVRLPAVDAPAASAASARAVRADSDSPTAPLSIVVVEDNADVRASLKSLLELEGHLVHEAVDGPSGVETILSESPDLAIVDIGLPHLDGYGVARSVRASLPSVRLVALTGYAPTEGANEKVGAAFDDYVVKPVEPSVLASLLRATRASAPRADTATAGVLS